MAALVSWGDAKAEPAPGASASPSASSPQRALGGRQLAYDNRRGVFLVRGDGRGRRRLGPGREPSWLPGGRLAVLDGAPIVIDSRGRVLRRLVLGPPSGPRRYENLDPGSLAGSPDGRRLAFTRALRSQGEERPRELAVIRTDGSGQRTLVLTRQTAFGGAEDPSFSPGGQRIAYVFDQGAIETIGVDGSKRRVLYHDKGIPHSPRWSPDGRLIAFAVEDDSGNGRVHVMRPDGSGVREVGPGDCPEWTPDGRALLVLPARGARVSILGLDGKRGGTLPAADAICPRIRPP